MLASGEQGSPRWGTQGCGVELVVQQPPVSDTFEGPSLNWTAERSKRPEPDVVQHDEQDVWGIGRSSRQIESLRFAVAQQSPNSPSEGL